MTLAQTIEAVEQAQVDALLAQRERLGRRADRYERAWLGDGLARRKADVLWDLLGDVEARVEALGHEALL